MGRCILPLLLFVTGAAAQMNFDAVAKRIITDVARVKPGEVVVVTGGKHTIPLMESVAIEAAIAGGMPNMLLNTDRTEREIMLRVPEKYLGQEPRYILNWYKDVDVGISLPNVENEKAVYADVSETRLAIVNKLSGAMNRGVGGGRFVSVIYPSRASAENQKVDFDRLSEMEWAAIAADYRQIARDANRLRGDLQGATVRITTPSGTDLAFSVGDRQVLTNEGVITDEKAKSKNLLDRFVVLPGGSVYMAPIENSANGKVVIPRTLCNYQPMTNVSFEFRQGKLENFRAAEGAQCFGERMAAYGGAKDMFGTFMIGLNPELHVIENPGDYRPTAAAGMVWVGVGENRLIGGKNDGDGGFGFPVVGATVEVNGRKVVDNGKLIH